MTNKNNNYSKQIEEEIQKQLNEVDRHVDRGGWSSLLVIILVLFVALYFITQILTPDNDISFTYEDRVTTLEKTVEKLESRIEVLEQSE